jgi:anti-sigma B factor antagonist
VLALTGDLDLAAVDDLRDGAQVQLAAGCRRLTLDLAGVTFLDSSGLGALVELRNVARRSGVYLAVVNVPPGPARIITIAGLAETFDLPPEAGASDG